MSVQTDPVKIFSGPQRGTSFGIVILMTIIAFEAMAVAPALPTAARELHGLGAYGWAFTGFLIANIVGMVVSGQLSDARGPRLPIATGLLLFTGGLLVSGFAPAMWLFVTGRVIQGLASGLLITAMYVLIGERYVETQRPRIFTAISTAWVLPSLVGPLLAGALTQHVGWRWVFLGLVPFVVIGSAMMLPVLKDVHAPAVGTALADPRRILRALAVAVGVAAMASCGEHPSLLTGALAVVGLGATGWGLRVLLPAGTLRARPGVPAPIALRGLLAGAVFGGESVVPLSLTLQHGYGATLAGLPLAGSGLTWALGTWWQGRDPNSSPARTVGLIRAGFGCVTVAVVLVGVTSLPAVPGALMFAAWAIGGLGAGLAMPGIGLLLLRYTTDADRGSDSAALQLADATTSALTTGVAGALIAAAAAGALNRTFSFAAIAAVMAVVALAGALLSGRATHPRPVSAS